MANALEQLDTLITDLFAGWNTWSTVFLVLIILFVIYVITEQQDPDTHPLLLARQSQASYVRQPGESAVFRSPEVPYGYPLRSGLAVRPAGTPVYAAGKDGDLRDIWRRVTGELPIDKDTNTQPSKILTVLGKEDIEDHNVAELTKEIAVIGKHLSSHGAKRVAVYAPNSVEVLLVLFAGAFYGFSVILLPYNQSHPNLESLLNATAADSLVAAAGSFPLEEISQRVTSLKQVVWTVEKTSRHVDWSEIPEGIGGKVDVSVWHELVADEKTAVFELPKDSEPGNIVFVWQDSEGKVTEVIEFTQKNIVAAVGAAVSALPAAQRFNRSDMFLPAESLTHSYPLTLTLAALFSRSNVALTSVAGAGVNLGLAIRSVAPTILVASAESAAKLHSAAATSLTDATKKLGHYMASRTLAAGRMPAGALSVALEGNKSAEGSTAPGKLRLIFVSERIGANTPPLSSNDLSDLRIFTKARVVYALTAAKVAGAITQTNVYDYRRGVGSDNKHSHFGVPLSSVEVKLKDSATHKTSDDSARGEIMVSGPAVLGGSVALGINGTFRDDNTLAYA